MNKKKRSFFPFNKKLNRSLFILIIILGLIQYSPWSNAEMKIPQASLYTENQTPHKMRDWGFELNLQTHLLPFNNLEFANNIYHRIYLRGYYMVTPWGGIAIRSDMEKRYFAHLGAAHLLFGDIRLEYEYFFSFYLYNQKVMNRIEFFITLPSSIMSRLERNISQPALLFSFIKRFPYGFVLTATSVSQLYWNYAIASKQGLPNKKWLLGYEIEAEYAFAWSEGIWLRLLFGQLWFNRYHLEMNSSQPNNSQYYSQLSTHISIMKSPFTTVLIFTIGSGGNLIEDGVYRLRWLDPNHTNISFSIYLSY